ncbi:hypothetical protein D3C84_422070 [compost metagenome]
MIRQAVALLVVADLGRSSRLPVQHPHAAAPGRHVDDVQHFTGAAVGADFQAGQIQGFDDVRLGIGLQRADFAHAQAVGSVNVMLAVVFGITRHRADFAQLIARVPAQRLPRLQRQQVAVGVETVTEVLFSRLDTIAHQQAAVAVSIGDQTMAGVLRAGVGQFEQVVAGVITVGLAVVAGHGGIRRHCRRRAVFDRAGLPACGCDQSVKRVVPKMADRFDTLIGEVADRQRGVFDASHIADRVVAVTQILQRLVLAEPG